MSIATLATAGGPLLALGYPGQPADEQECSIMTRINESVTGGTSIATPGMLDFGIAVARGNPGMCKRIAAEADLPIGITVRDASLRPDGLNNVGYAPTDAVGIMYLGDIYVTAYETVTDGDAVLAIVSQGGKLGGITTGAASADRLVIPGAQWVANLGQTTIAAGTIAKVRLTGTSNPRTTS
jgi:hypothetical protein